MQSEVFNGWVDRLGKNFSVRGVTLEDKKEISYKKLVLATGSQASLIPIKGIDKRGVWLIKKDSKYLKRLRKTVLSSKNMVIIGGGFIGVEIAEEVSSIKRLNVSLVEISNYCLGTTFDKKFTIPAEEKLKAKGVKIYTKVRVEEISGKNKVEFVRLSNGKRLPADLVILSIGARPNTILAKKAGLKIGEKGGIWVDEYLRTNAPDVFAIGDCAETRDFFTGKFIPVMLASTACAEARIAASNLYQIRNLRENKGTLGVFSTYVDGLIMGTVGFTEKTARAEGFDIVIGEAEAFNHHPATLPETKKIVVKLIFAKSSERTLLGGQFMGPESTCEMTNILASAIQQGMSVFDLNNLQISTHPLLTAAPTVYPLIAAAQNAIIKLKRS